MSGNHKKKSSGNKKRAQMDVEAPPHNNHHRSPSCDTDIFKSKKFWGTALCLLITAVLLLVILLPLSVNYIEYDEIAFKKDTISNKVETGKVYGPGRYLWAPEDSPVTFPSTYQHINFTDSDLLVFSETGLEFSIEADIYYKLTEDNLANVFDDFGNNYHDRFIEAIRASIKNTAPNFAVDEFVQNRPEITEAMFININDDLQDLHIEIDENKFFLGKIIFPDLVRDVFLNTAVQNLQNAESLLQQEVDLINKETDELLAEVDANITLVTQLSIAESEAIVKKSEAESDKIVEEATGQGIGNLFEQLNVTLASDRELVFQLFSILDNENDPQVIVGDVNAIVNLLSS